MDKQQKYLEISKQITENIGGLENIRSVGHCATRLRIVLRDDRLAKLDALEEVDLVKGTVLAGDQLQLIFGAGLVDEVCDVFMEYTGKTAAAQETVTESEPETETERKYNPVQSVVKSLSDIFVGIMPAILAGALLMGLTGVLGNLKIVQENESLYALNQLGSIAGNGIFNFLPMAVCYSAVKQYGGNPLLGMIMGAIMLDTSLANAYDVGSGLVFPEVVNILGWEIPLVGFQGGIIIALMMGFIVARLDVFFHKKVPIVLKRLLAPLLTIFLSTLLLFMVIGPAGRMISQFLTDNLLWMAENLGAFGYALFAGVQQIIVITGLHHIISAVEAQLIADTGRNFIHPLMSVALMGQGGAVLGYLVLNWRDGKARENCIPSFISILFGVSEPAIFGVNLRYRFPLICGCVGGAAAGVYVYSSGLTSIGFGTTSLPGLSLADPANDGYAKYLIAHAISAVVAFLATISYGKLEKEQQELKEAAYAAAEVVIEHENRGKALLHPLMDQEEASIFGEMQESELTQDLEDMLLMDGAPTEDGCCESKAGSESGAEFFDEADAERDYKECQGVLERETDVWNDCGEVNREVDAGCCEGKTVNGSGVEVRGEAGGKTESYEAVIEVISPASGMVKNISDSSDPTFASKILGDGIMIEDHDGKVYAPCDAEVLFVFDGGHAVGLILEDKTGVLLHCGVGTVDLEGKGFTAYAKRGQHLKKGELILAFDKAFVESKGYSSEVMMLFTEFGENRKLELCYNGWTDRENVIGRVVQK